MFRRIGRLSLLALVAVGWLAGARLTQYVHAPLRVDVPTVRIPKGAGLEQVVQILGETRVSSWAAGTTWGFRIWGHPRRVKAGVYAFRKGARLVDVFRDLEEGRVDRVKVTFAEGLTARDMAALLERADITRAAEFSAVALDARSPARWGLSGPNLEGYLFPDTYVFARELPARAVVDVMVRRFQKVSNDLHGNRVPGGADLLRWVTLASVVEKETGRPEERPLIAAVFRNRLQRGMPLQSDPTVIYGISEFSGNLTREDLRRDGPYNTYARRGLPPGPIANPGRASLQAVLNPAPVDYLYFVSRNDGHHVFSASYAEHARAVNQYQRRGRR